MVFAPNLLPFYDQINEKISSSDVAWYAGFEEPLSAVKQIVHTLIVHYVLYYTVSTTLSGPKKLHHFFIAITLSTLNQFS